MDWMNGPLVQSAIAMNMQTVRSDLRQLHERQRAMLDSLETNFLVALPNSIKNLAVSEFLVKFDGSVSKLFKEIHSDPIKEHEHLDAGNSQNIFSSMISSQQFQQQHPLQQFSQSTHLTMSQSKSILKNSKRKRIETGMGLNNLGTFQNHQAMIHNKENQTNYNQFPSNSKNISKKNISKNSFGAHNSQSQQIFQSGQASQASGTKSAKKMWRF